METLLPEMAAEIAQYLTVKDLAACCQVSTTMRELFGSDEVWRPRCDPDCEEYLRTTPCRVEPKLDLTLMHVGRWRSAYIREAHLWNNWAHGRFVKEEIGTSSSCRAVVFLNNDFIVTLRDDRIQLIDTSKNPAECVAQLATGFLLNLSFVQHDKFITYDGKNNFQVIRVDREPYTLTVEHSLCASATEGRIIEYDIVNSLFVLWENNLLHIWDLKKANRLKTQTCPTDDILQVSHDPQCENLSVIGYKGYNVHFYLYSLKDFAFRPFTKQILGLLSHAIVEHYVVFLIRNVINEPFIIAIYNYENSECLRVFESYYYSVHSMKNCFLYVNSHSEFVKVTPATGVVTCIDSNASIPEHGQCVCPIVRLSNLQRLNEKLFIVCYKCKVCDETFCKLWMITPTTTASSVTFPPDLCQANQACTKVVTTHNNVLYTYW